jgi:hypothetical protein
VNFWAVDVGALLDRCCGELLGDIIDATGAAPGVLLGDIDGLSLGATAPSTGAWGTLEVLGEKVGGSVGALEGVRVEDVIGNGVGYGVGYLKKARVRV